MYRLKKIELYSKPNAPVLTPPSRKLSPQALTRAGVMYSADNGANRSPSRVKCAKTSNFVKQQDTASMAPIKPNNTPKAQNKETSEQNGNGTVKHTFDKKGDWSLMTASRYEHARSRTPDTAEVSLRMPHVASCHLCRRYSVRKYVCGLRCEIVLGGVRVATSSRTIEKPDHGVRNECGRLRWRTHRVYLRHLTWVSNEPHAYVPGTLFVMSVHNSSSSSAQGRILPIHVSGFVSWLGSSMF